MPCLKLLNIFPALAAEELSVDLIRASIEQIRKYCARWSDRYQPPFSVAGSVEVNCSVNNISPFALAKKLRESLLAPPRKYGMC